MAFGVAESTNPLKVSIAINKCPQVWHWFHALAGKSAVDVAITPRTTIHSPPLITYSSRSSKQIDRQQVEYVLRVHPPLYLRVCTVDENVWIVSQLQLMFANTRLSPYSVVA